MMQRAKTRVSKAQIEAAKDIDLLTYFRLHEPGQLVADGNGRYNTLEHGSLVIQEDGRWFWNSGNKWGKTALDYFTHVRGIDFVRSVEILSGVRGLPDYVPPVRDSQPKPRKPFTPPKASATNDRAIAYLRGREISQDVIDRCIQSGTVYESRFNGQPVCVFAGHDETGQVRFAALRGTVDSTKRDVGGSNKQYSFCLPPQSPDSTAVYVCEAPIDALSIATLHNRDDGTTVDAHILSLGGTSPVALLSFLERNPHTERVYLALDNDEAGRAATKNIQDKLAADERFKHHVVIADAAPSMGKDWNDTLKLLRDAKLTERDTLRSTGKEESVEIAAVTADPFHSDQAAGDFEAQHAAVQSQWLEALSQEGFSALHFSVIDKETGEILRGGIVAQSTRDENAYQLTRLDGDGVSLSHHDFDKTDLVALADDLP